MYFTLNSPDLIISSSPAENQNSNSSNITATTVLVLPLAIIHPVRKIAT